jgi:transposase
LKADEGGKDKEIAQALNSSVATIEQIRQRFVEGNLEKALHDDPRPGTKCKLDGRAEAQLIALACSKAPEGHAVWSMRLLAGTLVELGVVESVSHETVRYRLKKRPQALAAQSVVHTQTWHGVRGCDGRRPGRV